MIFFGHIWNGQKQEYSDSCQIVLGSVYEIRYYSFFLKRLQREVP